ncbi:hypothetical protein Tco_1198153, partial [Tanacetum coccineum]
ILDLVLGGNQRVKFSRQLVLDGFLLETYSSLAQITKVDSEPPNGSKEDITNQCESEQALDVSADISENRASRNFDLMMDKWCLLKITLQAPFLNVQMTFEQRSSSLFLHQMTSDHNRIITVQNSKFTSTAMNSQVQSWFQKLFLKQTRQLHHDKSWNYYSTIK